ncbi:MAG: Ig-like domain-containing protein [Candidatus Aquicultor sp.]
MKRRAFILTLALLVVFVVSVSVAFAAGKPVVPTVSITAPANGATVSGAAVAVSADCTGGSGATVSGVTYAVDGGTAVAMTGPNGAASGTWTANWDSTQASNGSHTIAVTATNSSRKTATSSITVNVSNSGGGGGGTGAYALIAYNDLGMHCACPNTDLMILLPPFNTLRAQLIQRASKPVNVTSGVTVEYQSVENSEANLLQDTEYLKWLDNANRYFPTSKGYPTISRTNIVGLTGNKLNGTMKSTGAFWEATGIPNYPAKDTAGILDFFGEKRNPYLTANITAKDSTGNILATTSAVVPVSFGGCCGCHYTLSQNVLGISNPTPDQSFKVMSDLHLRDTGVDFYSMKPVRCSSCHADPAVDGPNAKNVNCTTTFSEALHLFHANSALVKSQYSSNIDNDCYQCHPDNNKVKCYRGLHQNASLGLNKWCSDCHGTILNRKDRTNYSTPWLYNSLPKCAQSGCHTNTYAESARSTTGIFGLYLASEGHHGGMLCTTCHGAPHSELPASNQYVNDNGQSVSLQTPFGVTNGKAIGVCDVCHIGRSTTWGVPPH